MWLGVLQPPFLLQVVTIRLQQIGNLQAKGADPRTAKGHALIDVCFRDVLLKAEELSQRRNCGGRMLIDICGRRCGVRPFIMRWPALVSRNTGRGVLCSLSSRDAPKALPVRAPPVTDGRL